MSRTYHTKNRNNGGPRSSDPTVKNQLVECLPADLLLAYKRDRVLSADAVLEIVPFGRTQLHKLSAEGEFPHPIRLSKGRVAWIEHEVLEWLDQRRADRDKMLAERREHKRDGV